MLSLKSKSKTNIKQGFRRYFVINICLYSLLGCNSNISNQNNKNKSLLNQHNNIYQQYLQHNMEPPAFMGDGFDDRTGMTKGVNCLINANDPNNSTHTNVTSDINVSGTVSSSDVAEALNFNMSGKANFGLYSASLSANYARSSINSRQSISFNYLQRVFAEYTYKIPGIGNNILIPEARSFLNDGMDKFTQICGNSVITGSYKGAILLVNVSVSFANATNKESFAASISGKAIGMGSISAVINQASAEVKKHASFSVTAMQLGGNPKILARIFGTPDKDGYYNITKCSIDNLAPCSNILNDIINYAQSEDFKKSINPDNPNSLYTFKISTTDYSQLGVAATLPELSAAEKEANQYLSETITRDRTILDFLMSYMAQGLTLNTVTQDWMNKTTAYYQNMIKQYDDYDIIDACYGDTNNIETRCIETANLVKDMHNNTYKKFIDFADHMASTIYVRTQNPSGLYLQDYILVPADYEANCNIINKVGQCTGLFAIYPNKTLCLVDTTADNNYFTRLYPSLVGKFYDCSVYMSPIVDGTTYLRRKSGDLSHGIDGSYQSYTQQDKAVNAQGWNAELFYSDSSTFKYNPI